MSPELQQKIKEILPLLEREEISLATTIGELENSSTCMTSSQETEAFLDFAVLYIERMIRTPGVDPKILKILKEIIPALEQLDLLIMTGAENEL